MDIIKIETQTKRIENRSEYWTIVFQKEGTSTLIASPMEVILSEGEIGIIPPGTVHTVIPETGGCFFLLAANDFHPFGEKRIFLLLNDPEDPLTELFSILLHYWNHRETNIHNAIINSLGDALYHGLAALYARNKNHDFRIERIVHIMYSNISNCNFSMQDCVKECGYSGGHFRKLFKAMTGESPTQFMNRIRIEQAKCLIHQFGDSKTLKEVAVECGFEDSLYFSRVFRKQEGISPREYLNSIYAD